MQKQTLNLSGRLFDLKRPLVMGIINMTPDSFYSGSRVDNLEHLRGRIEQIIQEGGDIVDIGGYSSRSGAPNVSPTEERMRLEPALKLLRDEYPDLPVSVDTFRADIAGWARDEYGVALINDISGGELDSKMFEAVASRQIPYILMHMRGTPENMSTQTNYTDVTVDLLDYFIERIGRLRAMGLHDIIIDPGFGFAKTIEQNYELLSTIPRLRSVLELPMLIGISRKSMIYRPLGITAEQSLNGTTVLHTYALMQGAADILRVHDVREAVEAVALSQKIMKHRPLGDGNLVEHIERNKL